MTVAWYHRLVVLCTCTIASQPADAEPRPFFWPRVYVYDLPEYWDVKIKLKSLATLSPEHPELFGEKCRGDLQEEYATHMYSVPMILMWRLMRSPRLTNDPSRADLFVVPMWPRQKSQNAWEDRCMKDSNLEVEAALTYLNERTAHRHIFVVGKGHVKVGGKCEAWWKRPTGLLKRAMRFAYSSDYGTSYLGGQERYGPFSFDSPHEADRLANDVFLEDDDSDYPHLVSVPYPSSIHSEFRSRTPGDWIGRNGQHSRFLASFVGGAHSKSTFAMPRQLIRRECESAGPDLCYYFNYDKAQGLFTCGLDKFMNNATFCFQPGGDSPYRKSLYDSYLTGCIPVVFGQYNARVSPWHFWPGHERNSMVVINASMYLREKKSFNVLNHLASIEPDIVRKMQHTIAANAHRLQYAIDEYPDDAVDILLKGAAHMARTRDFLIPAQLDTH